MKLTLGALFLTVVFSVGIAPATGGEDADVTVLRESIPLKLPTATGSGTGDDASISIQAGTAPFARERVRQTNLGDGAKANAKHRPRREEGMTRLAEDRAAYAAKQPKGVAPAADGTVSTESPELARKTPVAPLTSEKARSSVPCSRSRDIVRLSAARGAANHTDERDRLGLRLAAAYVGAGDLEQARDIYLDLTQSARREDIRQTAKRNLGILAKRSSSEGRVQ